jgi:hypothetical protein
MTSDFQDTLTCNPRVLPIVPPPPPLEIPDCVENLGCSTGPLLCKPSFEDDLNQHNIEATGCCDNETISGRANISTRIKLERDIVDPRRIRTIKELIALKGLKPSEFVPYIRDWNTNRIVETTYETAVSTKMSVILVERALNTQNGIARVMVQIQNNEILPSRFVWPNCNVTAGDCYTTD